MSVDSFLESKLQRPPIPWRVGRPHSTVGPARSSARLDRSPGGGACRLRQDHPRGAVVGAAVGPGLLAAWLSLDAGDNDPGRLWTHVAAALERAGCRSGRHGHLDGGQQRRGDHRCPAPAAQRHGGDARATSCSCSTTSTSCTSPPCHDQVEFLVEHLPPQAHLLITTRADPGLRLGRLRATGQLAEIRAADLAFNSRRGVVAAGAAARAALRRRHGSADGPHRRMARRALPGHPVTVGSRGPRRVRPAVQRRQPLHRRLPDRGGAQPALGRGPRLHHLDLDPGPVLAARCATSSSGRPGPRRSSTTSSAPTCSSCRSTRSGEWFRFHHLFAAVARSELRSSTPTGSAGCTRAPPAGSATHGHIDEAVTHLLASGSTERRGPARAGELAEVRRCRPGRDGARAGSTRWAHRRSPADPAAGVTAAWMAALSGDEDGLAAHLQALEEFREYGPLPDGTRSVESAIAMIQGLFGYGGPVEMARGARRAVELETDGRLALLLDRQPDARPRGVRRRRPRTGHAVGEGVGQRGGAGHHRAARLSSTCRWSRPNAGMH